MNRWLAIAAYQCRVDGIADGSIDFQVRYFDLPAASDVEETLRGETTHEYENPLGEKVSWPLVRILGIQAFLTMTPGDEIVGFIASHDELLALGRPDSA